MRVDRVLTVIAAVAAAAVVTLQAAQAAPSDAPTSTHVRRHAPARVTVSRRSYLHPGTETKTYAEHDSDYFRSPADGFDPLQNSTLFHSNAAIPLFHDRMPFPNCLDLAGFCK
jgi:hypothetical protein